MDAMRLMRILAEPDVHRQYVMVHEAAHAVIGDALDVPIARILIGNDPTILHMPNNLGSIRAPGPEQVLKLWQADPYLTHRTITEALHAVIILTMAAMEAEVIVLGDHTGGDGGDRENIEKYLGELGLTGEDRKRWEARLRRHTRALVRRYQPNILFVWRYLLTHHDVSSKDLTRLLRRAKSYFR